MGVIARVFWASFVALGVHMVANHVDDVPSPSLFVLGGLTMIVWGQLALWGGR